MVATTMLEVIMTTTRSELRLSHLSSPRQTLVRIAQRLGFGAIRQLHVRGGDPFFDPEPSVLVRRKNGATSLPHPAIQSDDFVLKREWVDFFDDLAMIGDGVILKVEVAHGLPIVHEFEDAFRA